MNKKATITLVFVAVAFVITALLHKQYADNWLLHLIFFMVEAALVGTLADWYAVCALYTEPLKMKWHTNLIIKYKDKLIEGIVQMVEKELLPKETLKAYASEINYVNTGINLLEANSSSTVGEKGWVAIRQLLLKLDLKKSSAFIEQKVKEAKKKTDISDAAGGAIKWAANEGYVQQLLDMIVDYANDRIQRPDTKEAIRRLLESEKQKYVNEGGWFKRKLKNLLTNVAEKTNALNIEDAADAFYNELVSFAQELRDPDHELRRLAADAIARIGNQLQPRRKHHADEFFDKLMAFSPFSKHLDVSVRDAINEWKNRAVDRISFQQVIEQLLSGFIEYLNRDEPIKYLDLELRTTDIKAWTVRLINTYWEQFKRDDAKKDALNHYVRQLVHHVIDREYEVIGRMARDTLLSLNDKQLKDMIINKVDEDLHAIRINGALVGGMIGGLLFLLLHFVYRPIIHALIGSI